MKLDEAHLGQREVSGLLIARERSLLLPRTTFYHSNRDVVVHLENEQLISHLAQQVCLRGLDS